MKKLYFSILVLFLSCNLFAQTFDWQWQNSRPVGNALYDIHALSSTRLVAFGTAGVEIISTDAGETWSAIYPDPSRRDIWGAYFINATTGIIVGGTSSIGSLIMKTTDGGATWVSKTVATTNILYDVEFIDANNGIACGAAGTVVRTTDGGETWTVGSATGTGSLYKIAILSSTIVYAGNSSSTSPGYLLKSTDFGATFTNATPTVITSAVYGMYVLDANHIWASTSSNGIVATTDGGTSWAVQQVDANTMYDIKFFNSTSGFAVDSKGIVWATTNAGTNWASTQLSTIIQLRQMDLTTGNMIIIGDGGNIYKSTNSGTTWTAKYTTASQQQMRKIVFKGDNNGWAGECPSSGNSKLLQTTDGGQTWTTLYTIANPIYSISIPTSTTWYIGCSNNTLYKTTNAGATFTSVTHTLTGETFWMMAFADSLNGYAGGSSGKIIKTTDGGNSWTDISTAAGFGTNTIYEIALIDANTFYLCGLGARLAKTTNGGTSFTAPATGLAGSFFTCKFKDINTGFVGGANLGVSKTTDGGNTWTVETIPTNPPASNASIWGFAISNNNIWASTVNGDILNSTDGGTTWLVAKKPSSQVIYNFAVSNNNLWGCGGEGAIIKGYVDSSLPVELTSFTSNIQGQNIVLSWSTSTEVNSSRFEIQRSSLNSKGSDWATISSLKTAGNSNSTKHYSFTDSKLQPGKYNYRLKLVDNDGTFSYSNIIATDVALPTEFAVSQNYPNPFNPTTKIDYQVPADAKILIEVYNIAGQRVAQIVNQEQAAGYYTVDFGSFVKLSSGVYIYRMIAIDKVTGNNFSSIKKMIMLK